MNESKDEYKKFLRLISGFSILVVGVVFILIWWPDVVSFFRGFLGFAVAVGGLLILYSVNTK